MENNLSNNTTKKTMDYANTFTKSIINQTENDLDIESNLERECNNLIKSARRKIQPKCCLFCSPKYKRYEESCSLYKIAGDKYKSAHCWHKAAICYENCSLIKKRLQQNPLNYYEQAYYCYDKMDFSNDLKNIFDMMNSLLEKEGKFFQVGKNYENMGIKMEKKEKYDIAIEYYLLAMKYYEKDFKHENIKTKLLIKLCELMVLHNYSKAENYVPNMLENIGINYLKNIMIKYMAKEYFGKAVLTRIYFNDDIQEAKLYINKYKTDNNNKYNTKNKITQDYRIKKKCTNTIQTIQQYQKKEFQKPNNTLINKKIEINKKYEIKKKPEIKINTNIDYSQYKRKKKEEIKTDTKKNFETIKKSNKIETKIKIKNESKTKKEVKEPKIIQRRENIRKEKLQEKKINTICI